MLSRRDILGISSAALACLAGCSGGPPSGNATPTSSPTESPTATVAPAYNIEFQNEFDPSTYTFAHDDPSGEVLISVEKVLDPETLESEVVFERKVEFEGSLSKSWPDAFEVDTDATEYILSAEYSQGGGEQLNDMSDTFRFAPGSYSTPDSATFIVKVTTERSGDLTNPVVDIYTE